MSQMPQGLQQMQPPAGLQPLPPQGAQPQQPIYQQPPMNAPQLNAQGNPQIGRTLPPVGQQPQQPQQPQQQPGQPQAGVGPSAAIAGVTNDPAAQSGDEPKKRRPRAARVAYREETAPKLTAVPTDWTGKKHLPLSKDDFQDEALFYDFKAGQARKQVAKYEQEAASVRLGGDTETRKLTKKAEKLAESAQATFAKLEGRLPLEAIQQLIANLTARTAGMAGSNGAAPAGVVPQQVQPGYQPQQGQQPQHSGLVNPQAMPAV